MGVPPTVPDPTAGKSRARWLGLILGVVVIGAAVAALVFYLTVWRFTPTAHRHVPAGTNIAMRADANKILLFQPVRDHLWPLAFEKREGGTEEKRLARIEQETGVSIPVDLREVIIASLDAQAWVAIIGGNIDKGRFVAGLDKVLREEGIEGWALDGELLVHSWGAAVGQAEDGTIIVGTNVDITRAALVIGDEPSILPETESGALTFAVNERAYRAAVALLPRTLPGVDLLDKIRDVSGEMVLSEKPALSVLVTPTDNAAPGDLASEIDAWVARLRLATFLMPSDLMGAKQALADTKVEAQASAVQVTAPWPYAAIDQAVKELADALRERRRYGKQP